MNQMLKGLAGLVAGVALASGAQAQTYPSKPITWVVPFTAGGVTDTTSRVMAKRIGELLGQQVVVENRPGAGGGVGTEQVARAPADGYTVLYGTAGTLASNIALYKNLRYKQSDFKLVHAMFATPTILVVNANKPYKTAAELIAAAKQNPGGMNFGSAGAGTGTHLTAELFQDAAGIKLVHVPYKGSAPAVNDLIGGSTDLGFDYPVTLLPHIKSGRLRALAVTGSHRLAALPDVPTMAELGFPQAEATSWSSIVVPAGTPDDIVKKLGDALATALADPSVVKPIEANGSTTLTGYRDQKFKDFLAAETVKWANVVKRSGASVD